MIKIGKCDGCGREGVVAYTVDEIPKLKNKHVLVCFGPFMCCNEECYEKARKGGRKNGKNRRD